MKSFTLNEVATLADTSGCYIVISNNKVYNLSTFLTRHPGGKFVIKSKNGTDVSKHFKMHSERGKKMWKDFQIGTISSSGCCNFT
jgi:cytochrome b involved in lipid metabolism|tara:strand:+ start:515 stop:769 length:255 start_codon:yes stop_codon:yes gene_type:complete